MSASVTVWVCVPQVAVWPLPISARDGAGFSVLGVQAIGPPNIESFRCTSVAVAVPMLTTRNV